MITMGNTMKRTLKRIFAMMMVCSIIMTSTFTTEAASAKPAKVTVKSTKMNQTGKNITVKFKKVKKATGYQVAYKTASAKKYTVKKTKKTSYVIKNAKKNTVYKIKVRAYTVKGNKTSYGKWSAVKTVKTANIDCDTCMHNWITIIDEEAWDEPVYEEQDATGKSVWYDNGIIYEVCDHAWSSADRMAWCIQHCVTCFPNCPDPDPHGWCAFYNNFDSAGNGLKKVQVLVGTKHHDAVTHQECTKCGATK